MKRIYIQVNEKVWDAVKKATDRHIKQTFKYGVDPVSRHVDDVVYDNVWNNVLMHIRIRVNHSNIRRLYTDSQLEAAYESLEGL
jgi:hypothetical protein